MKMSTEKYNEIKDGIQKIVDYHGKDVINKVSSGKTLTAKMWMLFNAMWFDFQTNGDHPAYQIGRDRVLPYKDSHWINKLYGSGINDNHIDTALKKIAKELRLDIES